jgi:hypothetical protein
MNAIETKNTREVFEMFRSEINLTFDPSSADELYTKLDADDSDFCIEIDGEEFRIIQEDSIRDIAQEEIAETIKDCYLSQSSNGDLPWWIEIDWNKTVQNCIDADGYGHHFSSYDGSEYEIAVDGIIKWYAFRTN